MNLYSETMEVLSRNGKTFDDVIAICGSEFQITKEDFVKYSNTDYDDGFGALEVAEDLVIIGNDFWLERYEYDGSECWEFKVMPEYKILPFKPITALTVRQRKDDLIGWVTLSELNEVESKYNEEVPG